MAETTEHVFTPEQSAKLLDLLGLPPDTADAELILATVADLVSQAAGEHKPSEVAAAAKRSGLDVIDTDSLAALRRDATEGRQLKAAAVQQRVEASVDDAIGRGKITPARRKHWVTLIGADPGMADVLASVPNETAAPLTEIGHGVGSESDELAARADWFR